MANVDAAFGFRPIGNDGGVYNGVTRRVVFPATSSTSATYIGDPVKLFTEDGQVGDAGGGYQAVIIAAGGDPVYGVVTSFEVDPDNLKLTYRAASTKRFAQVAMVDNALFEVQDKAAQGLANIGYNAAYVVAGGSAYTGLSGTEIVTSIVTNTGDVQLVGITDSVENDGTLSNANWIVKFNDPQSKPVRTGT